MARQSYPTAANILSSLGIKGAVDKIPAGESGASFGGMVPVLNEDGKIDLSFIPPGAAAMSVERLHNVAIVDPMTSETVRTGSVIAPYKTIAEAAASIEPDDGDEEGGYSYATRCAIVLMPGKYDDASIAFASSPAQAFIVCVGECVLGRNSVGISGMGVGGSLTIHNVLASGNLTVSGCAKVVCSGTTTVSGILTVEDGASVALSPESSVASTNSTDVSYTGRASAVGNTSSVDGDTVAEALDALGGRAVRVANMTSDKDGFHYDANDYTDIKAAKDGQGKVVFDLRYKDAALAEGINRLVQMWKNPTVGTLTAETVNANTVKATVLELDAIRLGGYKLTIDQFGYLMVVDGSTPVTPPQGVVLLRDSADNEVYVVGILNGRLYVKKDDGGHGTDVADALKVIDPDTGDEYSITLDDGRLYLAGDGLSGA